MCRRRFTVSHHMTQLFLFKAVKQAEAAANSQYDRHVNNSSKTMVDVFLICVIVIGFFLLSVIGLYLVVKYQHPDLQKNHPSP